MRPLDEIEVRMLRVKGDTQGQIVVQVDGTAVAYYCHSHFAAQLPFFQILDQHVHVAEIEVAGLQVGCRHTVYPGQDEHHAYHFF